MNNIKIVLIFLTTFVSFFVSNTNENFWTKKNFHKKFLNKVPEKLEIPGCKSTKIWLMIKYGNRAPNLRDIFLIERRLPKIRNLILKYNPTSSDILHDYDLRAFRKWESKLTSYDYYRLPKENEKELTHVAERMKIRFPSLLKKEYSSEVYKFKYAELKGASYYFTLGLFDDDNSSRFWYDNTTKVDPLFELNRLCEGWEENKTDDSEETESQRKTNSDSLLSKTVEEINERLKLPEGSINFEDIHLMHLCCLYETASNISTKSPWCSAFSVHNLKVLKYLEDEKYFSEHEYSRMMNERRACVAFDDLIDFLKSGNDTHKCTIYFTNSGAIMRVLLFFDKYNEEFPRKNLGITHVNPFESNLAFILYSCHGVLKVLTLHEEHVIRLPCCPFTILCELSKISEYYSHLCNFEKICDKEDGRNNYIQAESLVMLDKGSTSNKEYSVILLACFCIFWLR